MVLFRHRSEVPEQISVIVSTKRFLEVGGSLILGSAEIADQIFEPPLVALNVHLEAVAGFLILRSVLVMLV